MAERRRSPVRRLERLERVADKIADSAIHLETLGGQIVQALGNARVAQEFGIPSLQKDIERLLKEIRVYRAQLGLREV